MYYVIVSVPNLKITLVLYLLLPFAQQNTLCHIRINHMCGWPIIFHHLIQLFYLLYFNITSLTSPKITLALLLLLAFCKMKFCYTLRNSGPAKTGSAGPVPTPLNDAFLEIKIFCISEFYIPETSFCSNTNAVLQILFKL